MFLQPFSDCSIRVDNTERNTQNGDGIIIVLLNLLFKNKIQNDGKLQQSIILT